MTGPSAEPTPGDEPADGRRRLQRGDPWPPWGPGAALVGFVAGIFGAVLTGSIAFAITGEAESLPTLAAGLVGLWAGYGGCAVIVSRVHASGRPVHDLRLHIRWRDLAIGVGAGLFSSIVLVRLVYFVLVLVGLVTEDDLQRLSEPAQRVGDLAQGGGWVVLILLVGVGAPLVEEVFYRGVLQPSVIKRLGPVAGIALASLIFGIAHQQVLQLPALAAFGGVLGWLAWRHGRLGPSIVAHITFNLLTLVQLAIGT